MKQNKKIFLLGITGGVGAGKSQVLSILKEKYHAYLILSDNVGHKLREPGMPIYKWMVQRYGIDILHNDGTINPQKVAKIAFVDEQSTLELNSHTHPLIKEAILQELDEFADTIEEGRTGLAVLESALMTEGKLLDLCDEVWYIRASRELRIRRLMQNRGYSKKRCEDIISRQKEDREFLAESQVIINNDSDKTELEAQIERRMLQSFSALLNLR